MSIAIIIATHGVAAEQLLRTTEMLIGEQDNVAFIDFVPGENAETIIQKYQSKLDGELAHCDQVLFLVDTWGGSPFNAANRVADGKNNMDVVTGVNVPMLVETFMARDDNPCVNVWGRRKNGRKLDRTCTSCISVNGTTTGCG